MQESPDAEEGHLKLESSTSLNNNITWSSRPTRKQKKWGGLSGYKILASEKRQDLVKIVIKGLFLILFHAWGNDLSSKLSFKGLCPQGSVAQRLKCERERGKKS